MSKPQPQSGITARVCQRIVACGREPLDAKLLPAARQLFLDGVAVAVAGVLLYRYAEPRREAFPPWRWRRGVVH